MAGNIRQRCGWWSSPSRRLRSHGSEATPGDQGRPRNWRPGKAITARIGGGTPGGGPPVHNAAPPPPRWLRAGSVRCSDTAFGGLANPLLKPITPQGNPLLHSPKLKLPMRPSKSGFGALILVFPLYIIDEIRNFECSQSASSGGRLPALHFLLPCLHQHSFSTSTPLRLLPDFLQSRWNRSSILETLNPTDCPVVAASARWIEIAL